MSLFRLKLIDVYMNPSPETVIFLNILFRYYYIICIYIYGKDFDVHCTLCVSDSNTTLMAIGRWSQSTPTKMLCEKFGICSMSRRILAEVMLILIHTQSYMKPHCITVSQNLCYTWHVLGLLSKEKNFIRYNDHETPDQVTPPLLRFLHWLPGEKRINYKFSQLYFKVINDLTPTYLSDLCPFTLTVYPLIIVKFVLCQFTVYPLIILKFVLEWEKWNGKPRLACVNVRHPRQKSFSCAPDGIRTLGLWISSPTL